MGMFGKNDDDAIEQEIQQVASKAISSIMIFLLPKICRITP